MDNGIKLEPGDIMKLDDENGHYTWYTNFKDALEHAGYQTIKKDDEVA
ncbi:hypothetical protein [Clostridium sp. HBUAS56010]|nr:hypothetical protein [Clostridium sp. HBUAS56010]